MVQLGITTAPLLSPINLFSCELKFFRYGEMEECAWLLDEMTWELHVLNMWQLK